MEPSHYLTLELQDLILNASALVRLETNIYHIALHPSDLADLKSAIKDNLDSILYKFNPKFGGFLLGYKNVKVASDRGSLINDDFFIHFNIIADFYIFAPKVERVLYGIVNKKSPDHIGCLVHKYFNVSIPRPTRESRGDWLGASVEIGHKVTFVLKTCDFTGNLPYMQGSIISSCPANPDDEALSETKKKKKFQGDQMREDSFTISESQLEEISERLAKRKRETDDESGTSKKKKKKRKHKREEEEETEEEKLPEFNSLHMSSEDPDYGKVIEQIKESYLNENIQDIKKKNVKETARNKKRKLYIQDEFADIPQRLHSENIDELNASEQIENKKKKRKKHHDTGEKSEIVLPDLISLVESYKSSTQKLNESFAVSQKQSELTCSSQNIEESSPSISHLLNEAKKLAGKETLRIKKKDKDEKANLNIDSQEKHKKKKNKQDALENSVVGISRIETAHRKRSLDSSSMLKQSGKQAAEFEDTMITPNVVVKPVKNDRSKKKQGSDVLLSSSILSRITTVYSDSDNDSSHIPNLSETSPYNLLRANMVNAQDRKRVKLNKGKGDAMPERKSLPLLPSYSSEREFSKSDNNEMARINSPSFYEEFLTPSSLPVNSTSSSKPKKSVSFSEGSPGLLSSDTCFTPSDASSQSLLKTQKSPKKRKSNAEENIVESSSIIIQSQTEDPSMRKNSTSPSKAKKDKIKKSPVQEPKTSMLTMESKVLNKEEKGGSALEWKSKVPDFSNVLKILASPSKVSKSSSSPQSKKAAKNIVDVHDSKEFKASTSPPKKFNPSDLSNNEGQETPDNTANVKNKDKHKVKKKDKDKSKLKKDKSKLKKKKQKLKDSKKEEKKSKRKHEDEKDKESKTTNKVDGKKSKKKKDSNNSGLNDLKKFSNELLQKYLKEKHVS